MTIQNKGVTFVRHGLAKQDRQNHFGTKIFVPAFPENKLLDPKRCLQLYLERTQNFRHSNEEKKVFLALNEPHKSISAQTISNWIVKTIKQAYENDSLETLDVRAHSTRAIGPSWALFKGASLSSVLEAADWSSESTFCRFYSRDVEVKFLKV